MDLPRPSPLLFLCLLVCASSSIAQQASSGTAAVSDPQATSLVQRALVALTAGTPVSDATMTGTARWVAGSDDETGTATLKASASQDSRVDLSLPSGNRIEIRNHSALPPAGSLPENFPLPIAQIPQPAGEWIGPDGAPHAMAGYNIMTGAAWFSPVLTLETIASGQNYVLSYIGQETQDGATAVHISVSQQFPESASATAVGGSPGPDAEQLQSLAQDLSRMDFYFDPNSGLPTALDFNSHPDNNASVDIETEILFSDYQKMGGVLAPLHIQKYLNSNLVLDLQFTNATINSGLSASAFALQ